MIPEVAPGLIEGPPPHADKIEYIRCARLIACVSESTRADLDRVVGPLKIPVVVTPLGVGPEFRPGPAARDGSYLLYVGHRGGYKNFGLLLQALGRLRSSHPDLRLLAVGGGPLTEAERRVIEEAGLTGRLTQYDAPDAEMPGLYASAIALVMPSLMEGFGLPLLEAQASGCPCVMSELPVFREVAGDCGWFFDPSDVDALAGTLDRVLGDPSMRDRLVESGIRRAAEHTWDRTARLTAEAYRMIG